MSRLTTIIISIATIISTATSAARGKVIGNTIRNIGEMPLMGIGKRRISLGVRLAARVAGSRVLGLELALVAAAELELVPVVEVARRLGPAAAAETLLGRAVAEAATAWEEADSAAAAADVAAVGDERVEEKQMKSKANIMTSSKFFVIAYAMVNCGILVLASQGAPEQKQE